MTTLLVKHIDSSGIREELNSVPPPPQILLRQVDAQTIMDTVLAHSSLPIGNTVTLLQETLFTEGWGIIYHNIGLMRMQSPIIWRVIEVTYRDGERNPFPFTH
jgi:hypothetical protein